MNNTGFEVTYKALQAPDTAHDCSVVVARARTAMVSCSLVRQAKAPVFFERAGEGAAFTVRSTSRETVEALPASYGSVIGHFGVFERSALRVVPAKEQFWVVYTIAPQFTSYSCRTRRRLAREVGGRLADYVSDRAIVVRVSPLETTASIVVSGSSASELAALPLRFNAVFQRSQVLEIQ